MPKSPSALTTMWGGAILEGRRGGAGEAEEESEKGGCFTVPREDLASRTVCQGAQL